LQIIEYKDRNRKIGIWNLVRLSIRIGIVLKIAGILAKRGVAINI
jgi:hypothetical protein